MLRPIACASDARAGGWAARIGFDAAFIALMMPADIRCSNAGMKTIFGSTRSIRRDHDATRVRGGGCQCERLLAGEHLQAFPDPDGIHEEIDLVDEVVLQQ